MVEAGAEQSVGCLSNVGGVRVFTATSSRFIGNYQSTFSVQLQIIIPSKAELVHICSWLLCWNVLGAFDANALPHTISRRPRLAVPLFWPSNSSPPRAAASAHHNPPPPESCRLRAPTDVYRQVRPKSVPHLHIQPCHDSSKVQEQAACPAQRNLALSPRGGAVTDAGWRSSIVAVITLTDYSRPCKTRKIKCGEEKPQCLNCVRQGDTCDYSIRLNWFRSDVAHLPPGHVPLPSARSPPEGGYSQALGATQGQASSSSPPTQPFSPNKPSLEHRQSNGSESSRPQSIGRHGSHGNSISSPPHTLSSFQGATSAHAAIVDHHSPSPYTQDTLPKISHMTNTNNGYTSAAGYRDPISSNQLSRIREYPSPADSTAESSTIENTSYFNAPYQMQMPPPFHPSMPHSPYGPHPRRYPDEGQPSMAEHRNKRMRYSPPSDQPNENYSRLHGTNHSNSNSNSFSKPSTSQAAFNSALYSPSRYPGTIPTPAASNSSDDYNPPISNKPYMSSENADSRRLSVKSLLLDDFEQSDSAAHKHTQSTLDPLIHYGVDRGFPDLDVGKNNDAIALNGLTPALSSPGLYRHGSNGAESFEAPAEFGFGIYTVDHAHDEGGYYAEPVTVSIPRSLGELPSTLSENPMNLLYFHHFLNHTARILVPHDCSENPFRSILPKMALQDMNLLHLLLAYSASHRSRLLKHPEPANRIAAWVEDIFPALRRALDDPSSQISNANLATAIMLASLEIISPNTFEVPIPWQSHLNVARRMLMARGGAKSIHKKDVVSYFLSRWFAYLDVVGSLSGGKKDQPLFSGDHWANDELDGEDGFQIDCLTGFTSRCVVILARIAELAKQCDSERIDSDGAVIENWSPSPQITTIAKGLKSALLEARSQKYKGCPHRNSSEAEAVWDQIEMVATNEAFHWAGLIHLYRGVLRKPVYDPEVQTAVREIVIALDRVRKGGTAEACLLFPMFTAGCQAREDWQREKLIDRLNSVEGSGMTQVCC